jgi:hypothetical protein
MKRFDLGLLIVLFLCSFALLPLIREPGLPKGYDVLYHVYRAAEMRRSWDAGVYMPRWASSFYFGYGYPVFHYYASLCYYLTSVITTLTGVSAVNALRTVIAMSLLGGGLGMYLFSRRHNGIAGGMLSALVYIYSPYIMYTEPYTRGDYPELLAFGLAPWIFWHFDLLRTPGQHPRKLFLAALSVAALIITHNLMALVMAGLLGGWMLWQIRTVPRRVWLEMIVAALLGVGLSAYFWLPVFLERDAVQLGNLTAVAELDYRNFFIPFQQLLGGSPRADAGALNGLIPQYNLGLAAWVLGLSGSLALLLTRNTRKLSYFSLMSLAMIFLMLPGAARIWESLPFLPYLQFPWRFLGPLALCLAVVAGANTGWLHRLPPRLAGVALVAICLFPLVMAVPRLYVPQWDLREVDTSVEAYQTAEVQGLQRGTTFSGEFLPKEVLVVPGSTERLLRDYADGSPIDRSHREVFPSDVKVWVESEDPQHNTWTVEADNPFQMEALIFYFPGWHAQVDGEDVDVTATEPHGFMTFPVPAGLSKVTLNLENTPPRTAGIILSCFSLMGLLGFMYVERRHWPIADEDPPELYFSHGVGFATGMFFLLFLWLAFRPGIAWWDSRPGEALAAEHLVSYDLGDTFRLLGYDLARNGNRLDLTLYWQALKPPEAGYASFVHVSTGGPPIAQSDHQNPGGVPTLEWTTEGYMVDSHVVYLPEGMPPGEYDIRVGLWTCAGIPEGEPCGNGLRQEVFDEDGNSLGDAAPLTKLNVE